MGAWAVVIDGLDGVRRGGLMGRRGGFDGGGGKA